MISVTIDGVIQEAQAGERLIDVINRSASKGPQVCYHPQLGPIQTCDTCMVMIDGQLFSACATVVSDGLIVDTKCTAAGATQKEAFDRLGTSRFFRASPPSHRWRSSHSTAASTRCRRILSARRTLDQTAL